MVATICCFKIFSEIKLICEIPVPGALVRAQRRAGSQYDKYLCCLFVSRNLPTTGRNCTCLWKNVLISSDSSSSENHIKCISNPNASYLYKYL